MCVCLGGGLDSADRGCGDHQQHTSRAATQVLSLRPVFMCARAPVAAGIVRLLRDLDKQARKAGGAVYMLNGNHESLNVCGDFRWVQSDVWMGSAAGGGGD